MIRLAERAGGDPRARARSPKRTLRTVRGWLKAPDRDLYLVGGAWRALARIHMAQTGYPLQMVHHYTIGREEARDLTGADLGRRPPRAGADAGPRRAGASTTCRSPPSRCAACCA